jgi:hypothetical protein
MRIPHITLLAYSVYPNISLFLLIAMLGISNLGATGMRVAFVPLLFVLLVSIDCLAAGAGYLEKQLGSSMVRLPQLDGFPAACEENKELAQRAAALSPKSAAFVTCFVETNKWQEFASGRAADLYPYIAITAVHAHASGPYTATDFQKLRRAAQSQLGDLITNRDAARAQLEDQESALAANGSDLRRNDFRLNFGGFFHVPGEDFSFSHLSMRRAILQEGGQSKELCEASAVSTILFNGRLLNVMVVDDCVASPEGLRARDITASWLRAFWDANGSRK